MGDAVARPWDGGEGCGCQRSDEGKQSATCEIYMVRACPSVETLDNTRQNVVLQLLATATVTVSASVVKVRGRGGSPLLPFEPPAIV